MDPLLLLFGSLTVTLIVGIPIAFGLTLSSLLVIWYADLPLVVAVQQMFHGINGSGRSRRGAGRGPDRRARPGS